MSKRFKSFQKQVSSLLFEDSYVTHGTIDNLRAGHIGDEPEDVLDLPLDPTPQAAVQLSGDLPPIEDPDYAPINTQQLSAALSALAQDLPDEADLVGATYEKFRKFVEDNKTMGIKVVDDGGNNSPKEVSEARALVRNILIIKALQEQSYRDDETDAYGNRYDEDPLGDLDGPTEEELENMENPRKAEPTKDESTLADLADEMGLSTSGIKRLEAEALKKLRLMMVHFPDDVDPVKEMAMEYFAKGLLELELIDAEEATDLMMSKHGHELKSFRQFMWDGFLNNVYKKMLRDAEKQGITEKDLGTLQPGLLDRSKAYFTGLPDAKKMKVLVSSLAAAE
tara:strand:- start:2379 stop:3392 length:1014 start_codon:yes stop_codon:yes gene_type:complete